MILNSKCIYSMVQIKIIMIATDEIFLFLGFMKVDPEDNKMQFVWYWEGLYFMRKTMP